MLTITNEDNMQLMARYPDKYFDLAIVDPPYGETCNLSGGTGKANGFREYWGKANGKDNWNTAPDINYFNELFRVSKNQIIWGANYYTKYLPARNSWIVWDKIRSYEKQHMAEGELAWHSMNTPLVIAKFLWNGASVCEPRYKKHPHEKPILLYKWLLDKYAKPGYKILDTHLGSGSIAIACHDYGYDLTACELDKDYFDDAMKRITDHQNQLKLAM